MSPTDLRRSSGAAAARSAPRPSLLRSGSTSFSAYPMTWRCERFGVADLVLVPGLVGGRQRWRWVAGRAALNLAIVGVLLRSRSGGSTPSRPLAAAVGLAIVTVGDLRVGRALYAARRLLICGVGSASTGILGEGFADSAFGAF